MKIKSINLYHLRMPLQSHFETSFGRVYDRDCILLEVHSDGLVGYGECAADRDPGYSYETVGTSWHILSDFIIPLVLGVEIQDAFRICRPPRWDQRTPNGKSRSRNGPLGSHRETH